MYVEVYASLRSRDGRFQVFVGFLEDLSVFLDIMHWGMEREGYMKATFRKIHLAKHKITLCVHSKGNGSHMLLIHLHVIHQNIIL